MPPARFEPAITANERPQTHALDGAATAITGAYNSRELQRRKTTYKKVWLGENKILLQSRYRAGVAQSDLGR
jgi:hypothetical protein